MAAHGGAVAPEHLVDDAPSEAASWTQRVKKKTHNVADLLNKLKASKAVRKDYRAMVDLKLKKVIIACVLCWTTVSCSNMTTGQCQHDDRCFKRAAAVPTPTISAKRLCPKQQRLIDRFFALFVATSGVPYAVCKNKWLKRALTALGADTLSPKRLKTTLDKGAKKTAQFYADMHESLAMKVTCGDPKLLLGVIMDSPSTNRAALRLLERKYHSWICMTCCVHAMNLICKDLANENKTESKHTAVGGFLKQVQHISKVLSDCDKICNALQVQQTAIFGDVREIATHCATRFAILHKICRDLQRSKAALCEMVASGAWETLKSASVNSYVLEEMQSPCWWKKLDVVVRLMQPISNAIHRLEGDHPTLSQVMRIWDDLVEHAKTWAASRGDVDGEDKVDADFVRGVHKLFKDRAAKHYQPVMAVARLLDPINFKYLNHVEQPYPDFEILTEMQRVELEPTIARLAEVPIRMVQAELVKFENTEWSPAMKRRALSILSIQQPPGRAVIPIASINARKAFWSVTASNDFPVLAKAAVKVLSVHVSTAAAERNWSKWSLTYSNALRSNLGVETAKRDIYLKANVEETDNMERDNMAPPQETLINIMA